MSGRSRATAGKGRKALSRERIVSSATRIVKRKGSSALSMRALASDLGISAPSLYWHFRTREELVGEIVRTLVGDLQVEDPGGEWIDRLRAHACGIRNGVFARPELLDLLRDGSSATAELAPLGLHFLLVLEQAGFEARSCVLGARLMNWQVWSYIVHEARLGWTRAEEDGRAQPHLYEFPLSTLTHNDLTQIPTQLLSHLTRLDADELFEFALDAILARLASEHSPEQTQGDPS